MRTPNGNHVSTNGEKFLLLFLVFLLTVCIGFSIAPHLLNGVLR